MMSLVICRAQTLEILFSDLEKKKILKKTKQAYVRGALLLNEKM